MQQANRTLAERGTQEDVSTGTTPRKRAVEYVDQWKVTKSREEILQEWREKGLSRIGSDTFVQEHVPLPTGPEREEQDGDQDMVKAAMTVRLEEAEVLDSPPALSFGSSASSLSPTCHPAPLPVPVAATRKGTRILSRPDLPSIGTLTDRPTNVPDNRRTRRAR
jgi:kinesin family member 11